MLKKTLIFIVVLLGISSISSIAYAKEEGVAGISIVLSKCEESNLMYTTSDVNFREKADSNSNIYYTISKNTKVFAIEKVDNWIKILHKGKMGFVHFDYLAEIWDISRITDDEIEILQRITEAEATGGSVESKMNVTSVIINRLNHMDFPSTIKDVVFQDKQFTPIADRRYFTVEVTEDTIKAVQNVLEKGVTTEAIYFANMSKLPKSTKTAWDKTYTYLFTDDINHSFYK